MYISHNPPGNCQPFAQGGRSTPMSNLMLKHIDKLEFVFVIFLLAILQFGGYNYYEYVWQ